MSVTDYFQIGNLSVPSSWIAFIVAVIFAYGAVRARFGKQHAEVMADTFFIVVIVWKLSVLLTDFGSVLRSPLAVIYFDGGAVGFYLGLLVAAGKIVVDRRKGRLVADSVQSLFTGTVIAQVAFQIMMVVLNDGEWLAQGVTLLFFGVFTLFFWLDSRKAGEMRSHVLLFMAVHLFVAACQPQGLISLAVGTTLVVGFIFMFAFSKERSAGNGLEGNS